MLKMLRVDPLCKNCFKQFLGEKENIVDQKLESTLQKRKNGKERIHKVF